MTSPRYHKAWAATDAARQLGFDLSLVLGESEELVSSRELAEALLSAALASRLGADELPLSGVEVETANGVATLSAAEAQRHPHIAPYVAADAAGMVERMIMLGAGEPPHEEAPDYLNFDFRLVGGRLVEAAAELRFQPGGSIGNFAVRFGAPHPPAFANTIRRLDLAMLVAVGRVLGPGAGADGLPTPLSSSDRLASAQVH